MPYSRAMRDTKRARALRDEIPAFGRALEAGEVEVEKVDILRAAMDRSPARAGSLRADGGASLARIASTLAVREWRRVVDAWAATVDPEAEERAYRAAAGRRELFVSPTTGGYHVSGWLDVESGQVVRTVLDAVGATLEGRDEGSPTGYRPRGEVMADALVTVARTVLGGGVREGSRIKPQVTISVPYATARRVVADAARSARAQRRRGARPGGVPHGTMRTSEAPVLPGLDVVEAILGSGGDPARLTGMQPATYGDGRVVPPSVLAAHLCDGAYTRVIFGPAGEPLDVGRESRLFTRAQVKALRERDGGCQFPGCAAPVGWCDAHHTLPWSRGGRTDIDHAILLCTTHHHELHRHGWSVHRYADRWEFLGRDGELRATRPRHQRAAPQRLPVPTRT